MKHKLSREEYRIEQSKNQERIDLIRGLVKPCFNCKEIGKHFVTASLGEPGFFICEKK